MEFRESLELLRRRLDGSLKDHAEKTDYNDIGDIYRLQEYSETHYYMKAVHDYTPAEVEKLLAFVDPLEVAFWCREESLFFSFRKTRIRSGCLYVKYSKKSMPTLVLKNLSRSCL